ncbi:MAG: Gfo/Idh/MocA family oxidoreductase [Caldilineaceae bacterium]
MTVYRNARKENKPHDRYNSDWSNRYKLVFKFSAVDTGHLCRRRDCCHLWPHAHAEELAAKYQGTQVFTDYNEMINNGRLDGIIVASPDDLHYPMVMAAIKLDCTYCAKNRWD